MKKSCLLLHLSLLILPKNEVVAWGTLCDVWDNMWFELDDLTRFHYIMDGWLEDDWDSFEHLRWYYSEWKDMHPERSSGLRDLGWTQEKWEAKGMQDDRFGSCVFERPLVELKPWSRLLSEEQDVAAALGFDKNTWLTPEFAMIAWDPKDGTDKLVEELADAPATLPSNGFHPIKLSLNISELVAVNWDTLAKSDELVWVDDPEDMDTDRNNDETRERIPMYIWEFVEGIREGKPYYMKYENAHQEVIEDILGGTNPSELIEQYLEGTEVGDIARIGEKYKHKTVATYSQLYIGGAETNTGMHLDIQSFNFLFVADGKKRIRLMPHDQRTAGNFTWGLETFYSVWTGYDLLNADPLPPNAVEIILGPGEGLMFPYLSWHAVENIEPTIAFGYIRDFPGTSSGPNWCTRESEVEN